MNSELKYRLSSSILQSFIFVANAYHHYILSSVRCEAMHFRLDCTRELKVLVGGNFSD